jgi:hypothetical protein
MELTMSNEQNAEVESAVLNIKRLLGGLTHPVSPLIIAN